MSLLRGIGVLVLLFVAHCCPAAAATTVTAGCKTCSPFTSTSHPPAASSCGSVPAATADAVSAQPLASRLLYIPVNDTYHEFFIGEKYSQMG